jgi:hypothetical protein
MSVPNWPERLCLNSLHAGEIVVHMQDRRHPDYLDFEGDAYEIEVTGEYRRADLPPTPEEALRCPEVRAMVEALETILTIPNSEAAQGIMKCYALASLAAFQKEETK